MIRISSFVDCLAVVTTAVVLSSCTPIGAAAGAGATLGIASAKEGGISGAATDLRIKTFISEKWFSYNVDTFRKLNLTVDQGRVLITGIVQSPDQRVEAVRLAWQVSGVKQVINEIRVADSEGISGYVRDTWISTRLRTAMTFDRDIQAINYSIDTVDGTVYLMGVARSQKDLDKTVALARTISGVKQVVTYVKPAGQAISDGSTPASGQTPTLTDPTLDNNQAAPAQNGAPMTDNPYPPASNNASNNGMSPNNGMSNVPMSSSSSDPYAPSSGQQSSDPYASGDGAPVYQGRATGGNSNSSSNGTGDSGISNYGGSSGSTFGAPSSGTTGGGLGIAPVTATPLTPPPGAVH